MVTRMVINRQGELEWERGRRAKFARFRKDQRYYLQQGVKVKESYRKSSRGVEIFTKEWLPAPTTKGGSAPDVKALIFLCHGYGDTCNYFFDKLAIQFVKEGYGFFGLDYEGHGLSEGLHVYIPDFGKLVDDCVEYFVEIKGRPEFRKKQCFLFAESMGGAVALISHFKRPEEWNGAILLAPMCKIAADVSPHWVVSEILKKLAFAFPAWKAVPQRDLAEFAFRVPAKRATGLENPLGYRGRPRLKTALELLNITRYIADHMKEITLPFLVLHGEADRVTDPACSRELFNTAASKDKRIKTYPGSWHCLLSGEPDNVAQTVMSDILSWLDSRCSGDKKNILETIASTISSSSFTYPLVKKHGSRQSDDD
ncbi:hypothetical protein CBR_g50207 [Chara braunii]|uniref:Serine aminopeptidase S33 domain-containing protein n=1 Tax=Chara braunii TaxID=69332 RepID=A0A388M6A3_CHABU|nr:hypothetical protein CBR_g50207 [Chara braunii]|eukprot:GBG90114.1 hypothetical protein CBR_g50207 [Chara braunii]